MTWEIRQGDALERLRVELEQMSNAERSERWAKHVAEAKVERLQGELERVREAKGGGAQCGE